MNKRKPKGWVYRYQLILRWTKFDRYPDLPPKLRWHKIKHYGRNQGAGTFGPLYPHPGDDIDDETLIRRAGLIGVTVPVEIIRTKDPAP